MRKSIQVKLGRRIFKSKKDAMEATKRAVHKYKRNIPITNEDDPHAFSYFNDLIMRHPDSKEKIGCGIDYFIIRDNQITPEYGELGFVRKDGTKVNFSYKTAVNGVVVKAKQIVEAMREAISTQITDYKYKMIEIDTELGEKCSKCLKNYQNDNPIQIDHVYEFKNIANDFINYYVKTFNGHLPTKFDEDEANRNILTKEDQLFREEWKKYHKKHATLRILCRKCNIERNKH